MRLGWRTGESDYSMALLECLVLNLQKVFEQGNTMSPRSEFYKDAAGGR